MVTINEVYWQYPAPMPEEVGFEFTLTKFVVPLWLKSDFVEGKPARWPRTVLEVNLAYEVVSDMGKDMAYQKLVEAIDTAISARLYDPEVRKQFLS